MSRHRLLIANRGEIAVRILRCCRELGIESIAVYSEADASSPHVEMADFAFPIGPAPAAESYLRVDKLLEVAELAGATMVHPGYGFLAENADFAHAVEKAGLIWVGPSPEAIRVMGSKTASRRLAVEVGAPLIPGTVEPLESLADLEAFVAEYGLPVMLKAVAGGGGKGMRRITEASQLATSWERARSEGQSYFGDPRVYVEQLILNARHVEVQIAADHHGQVIHLGERECSLQRRHQKVVEEAPSPVVGVELRRHLGQAAVNIARGAGYTSVGTVEMLLAEDGSFYFLEMNTRLQVEHPVTEMVYGIDLVAIQIAISLGEPLGIAQADVVPRGHAIEVRVYAEDAARGFAPQPGRIAAYVEPGGPGVRVDSGVRSGSVVPLDYDPMLSKLIVWGADREAALRRLRRAIDEYRVVGVGTTLPLYRALLELPEIREGRLHTGLLDELLEGDRVDLSPRVDDHRAVIAAAVVASLSSGEANGDPFDHGADRGWGDEGRRLAHGRFPR